MKIFGKRVIKTALAVLICLIIYIILMVLDLVLGVDRDVNEFAPTNWYTPFFASIATVYAMQNNPNGSISQAKIRGFGSIIGGTYGAILIFIYEFIYAKILNVSDIWSLMNDITFKSIEFLVTTIGILFLIPLTVKLKNKNAVFISCLTYLSVTISIRNGGMNVFIFGFNRILSTIIGVLISLYINTFPHFKKRNTNILFISTLENSLYDKKELSSYTKYMMNSFSFKGAKFSLMTTKTMLDLNDKFNGVRVDTPLITFNGSTLFHQEINRYEVLKSIDNTERHKIDNILNKLNISYFLYCVDNGHLHCYNNKLESPGAKAYYDDKQKQSGCVVLSAIPNYSVETIMYFVNDDEETIDKVISELNGDDVDIVKYKYFKDSNYYSLIIQPKGISKLNASKVIEEREKTDYTIAILNGKTDLCFINNIPFTMCLSSCDNEIKSKVDYVMDSNNPDDVLRFIYKVFKKKNYKKYLEELKEKNNK